MPVNGPLRQAYEHRPEPEHWCTSHGNHCRVTCDDFIKQIFAGFLLIQYLLSCRSSRDSVALLICGIFDRCNLPLDEFGDNSETSITEHLIVHHVRLRNVPAITCVILHASLYFCRISNVYQRIGCILLRWTLDFANVVVWSYFHVVLSWSILWKANVLIITPHLFSWREELLTIFNPCP